MERHEPSRPTWLTQDLLRRLELGQVGHIRVVKPDHVLKLAVRHRAFALHLRPPHVSRKQVIVGHAVATAAADVDVTCPTAHADLAGNDVFDLDGRVGDVTQWIEHNAFGGESSHHMIEAAATLGPLDDAMATIASHTDCTDAPWLSPVRVGELLGTSTDALREDADRLGQLPAVEHAVVMAHEAIDRIGTRLNAQETPYQLTHGDFGGRNVLLRGTKVAGVVDFGRLDRRPRLFDLAWMIFFEFLHERIGARHWAFARRCCDVYRRIQ